MGLIDALQAPSSAARPRLDRAAGKLAGTRCADCATPTWPARAVCHRCGSTALEPRGFGPLGELLTHTEVWTPRPGLEVPYRLGQVRLHDGPTVFCHVRELAAERPVPLTVRLVLADDDDAVPPFWFEPDDEKDRR